MSFVERLKSHEYTNWLLQKVSLDHDGTIADARQAVTDEFNFRHGTNHDVTELYYWDAVIDWCLQIKMSRKAAMKENSYLWYKPRTLYKAEPMVGAVELLRELENRKDTEYMINSSRRPSLHKSTLRWYKNKIGFVPVSKIFTGLPDISEGLMSKIWRIQRGKFRLHLEDIPEQAKAILDYTDATVILLSNSQVLDGYEPDRLIRIHGEAGKTPNLRAVNDFLFS